MGRSSLGGAALAAVAVAAMSGCGGGAKSGAPTVVSTTTTTAAAAATTSPATTTQSTGGSFSATKNCKQLAELAAKVQQSVGQQGTGAAALNREADALNALADAAPDAIKADLKTFADAYASFARAYSSAGLSAGKTPTPAQIAKIAQASRALATPKLRQALQHLEAWGRANCGGLTSTTP